MDLTSVIGEIPFRMALAGGWIDQPFISRLNPGVTGSMVVVCLEPNARYMERCGMATGTRNVALKLWDGSLPDRDPADLVRELYAEENRDKPEPSGSQDMIGLIYPGASRLDYNSSVEGGYFPARIETTRDPGIARWLEETIRLLPVNPRPPGYNPLEIKNLDPEGACRLGETGKACFEAILKRDARALGASMNACMECWEALLPRTVSHPTIQIDLKGLLRHYQSRSHGAMYSGCGGGYLIVVSEEPIPGSMGITVRI